MGRKSLEWLKCVAEFTWSQRYGTKYSKGSAWKTDHAKVAHDAADSDDSDRWEAHSDATDASEEDEERE